MTKSKNTFRSVAAGGPGVSVQSVAAAVEPESAPVSDVLPVSVGSDQQPVQVPATEAVAFAAETSVEVAEASEPVAVVIAEESVSDPAEAPLSRLVQLVKEQFVEELTDTEVIEMIDSAEVSTGLSIEGVLSLDNAGEFVIENAKILGETGTCPEDGDDDGYLRTCTKRTVEDEPGYSWSATVELKDGVVSVSPVVEPTAGEEPKRDEEDTVEYSFTWRSKQGIPAEWTNDEIHAWLGHGGEADGRTAHGTFVLDPTRMTSAGDDSYTFDGVNAKRPISAWDWKEVEDAFALKLHGVTEDHFGLLVKQLRQLTDVPTAWSIREVIDNVTQQIIPKKTSNGAWVNDVTRGRRPASDWTSQELEAWADGELKAPAESSGVQLGIELNKRFDLRCLTNVPADIIRLFKQSRDPRIKPSSTPTPQPTVAAAEVVVPFSDALIVKELPQGLTKMNVSFIEGTLQRYYDTVAPGKSITVAGGEAAQRQLDTLFRYILKLEDAKGFKSAMDIVREFVRKHRATLFSATYVFRFTGALRTDQNIQETHINLLDLFNVFTDPTQLARAQCDVPTMVAKFPADRQTWLIEYFTKYC